MDYQDTITTLAEADDLDMTDAELAAQELLTGNPCTACGLPVAVADVDGITCTIPTYTERVLGEG